jgi:O-antigen/teichoic acid export membrane protein
LRLRGLLSLVRFEPHETRTPAGRARERQRRIALTAAASGLARAIGLLTNLITVPLAIGYLGVERYGLWMAISSLIAMVSFLDLGIGNGLISAIAEADGRNDREEARRYVSAATCILCVSCGILLALFALGYPWLPWQILLNVSDGSAAHDGAMAAAALVTCFALGLPLSLVWRIHAGFQEGFAAALWGAAGSAASLIGVVSMIALRESLPWLVAASAAGPLLSAFANGVVLYLRRPWLRPHLGSITGDAVRRVFRQGILFFALQVAMVIGYQSDNFVINQVLGPEQVTQYAVPLRLFTIAPLLLNLALGPLWPAYAEAAARGDADWVRRTLGRSIKLALLATGPPVLILVLFGARIMELWVGNKVVPPFELLLALGLWSVIVAVSEALAMFMNGLSILKLQVICASIMAIFSIALKIVLAGKIGVSGVAYASVVAHLLCILIPLFIYLPRLLRTVELRPVGLGTPSSGSDVVTCDTSANTWR